MKHKISVEWDTGNGRWWDSIQIETKEELDEYLRSRRDDGWGLSDLDVPDGESWPEWM